MVRAELIHQRGFGLLPSFGRSSSVILILSLVIAKISTKKKSTFRPSITISQQARFDTRSHNYEIYSVIVTGEQLQIKNRITREMHLP